MFCSTHLQLHTQEAKQEIASGVSPALRESLMRGRFIRSQFFEATVDVKDIKWNSFFVTGMTQRESSPVLIINPQKRLGDKESGVLQSGALPPMDLWFY